MKAERIRWLDSVTVNYGGWDGIAWHKTAMTKKAMTHETVGYVLAETKVALLVAQSRNGSEDRFAGALVIPQAAVISRKRLK